MYDLLIARARVLSCLSRLAVLQCTDPAGMYAGDIARSLGLSAATVSHHLRALERAGLVCFVRQGRQRLYRSTGERLVLATEREINEGMV